LATWWATIQGMEAHDDLPLHFGKSRQDIRERCQACLYRRPVAHPLLMRRRYRAGRVGVDQLPRALPDHALDVAMLESERRPQLRQGRRTGVIQPVVT
jgi:hypothetical protein